MVLWAAFPFFHRGWDSILNRSPNMWTLISLGVGAAYLYDSSHAPGTTTAAADQRPLVNWDVVGAKWDTLTHRARTEWARLAG